MILDPKVLENRFVRLEPLAETHKAGLRAACAADPATWNELYPFSMLDEHFEPVWDADDGRCHGRAQPDRSRSWSTARWAG